MQNNLCHRDIIIRMLITCSTSPISSPISVQSVGKHLRLPRKQTACICLFSCIPIAHRLLPANTKAPVTPGLRPGYDLPATEKWATRRNNVRLVSEVVRLVTEIVGDRKGQISRNKVVVMFKTQSHRAYDQVTTYLRSKNVGIVGQS